MTDLPDAPSSKPTVPLVSGQGTLPAAFVAEQERMRSTRAVAARALTTRRWRRRVLPPLAVTSAALLATGAAGGWVNAQLAGKSTPPAAVDESGQVAALQQLRKQLSADQQALAAITVALNSSGPQSAGSPAIAATTSAPAPVSTAASPPRPKQATGNLAPKPAGAPRIVRTTKPVTTAPAPVSAAQTPVAKPTVLIPMPTPAAAPTQAPPPSPTQVPAPAPPPVHATTGASGAKP